MEPVQHDQAAAAQDHRHGRARHRIHMDQRQRRQHPLAFGSQGSDPAECDIPAPGQEKIAVGQDAAFGAAGGARRIEEGALRLLIGRAVRVRRRDGGWWRIVTVRHQGEGPAGRAGSGAQLRMARRRRHDEHGFRVTQ